MAATRDPGQRPTSAPFAQAVFAAMNRLYPDVLADKSFDNTGVLLEAPSSSIPRTTSTSRAMLTIDLTTAVANEAIEKEASVIVTYHPIIFRALKSLTLANTQQSSLLKLAAKGISVYAPHTAVDAAVGGNADWLSDILVGKYANLKSAPKSTATSSFNHGESNTYKIYPWPYHLQARGSQESGVLKHSRAPIVPNKEHPGAGMGRIVTLESPADLKTLLNNIASGLGSPKAFKIGLPQGTRMEDFQAITTVGICAGSGASVVGSQPVDAILTGEMSHHEVLAAVEKGQVVVCLNHSNSERDYLSAVMQPQLQRELEDMGVGKCEVFVSQHDRDPLEYIVLE